jgi:hypothetical protein
MVVCHIERIPEKENLVEKIKISKIDFEKNVTNNSIESDDLSK